MYRTLERIHDEAEPVDALGAARAAFWLGFRLLGDGELSRGSGWLARAERLVELAGCDCVERGYLLLPQVCRWVQAGEYASAYEAALQAEQIADRFAERDLRVFARNLQGRVLLRRGEMERGLKLLDEAMLSVTSGGPWRGPRCCACCRRHCAPRSRFEPVSSRLSAPRARRLSAIS
jgi:hypothetical protein